MAAAGLSLAAVFALLYVGAAPERAARRSVIPPVSDRFDAEIPMPPSAEALPRFGQFVEVDELPVVLVRVAPEIPAIARQAIARQGMAGGTVTVQALVDKAGLVRDVRVVKSVPLLDDAAEAAVLRWRFRSARMHGSAVAVWVSVPVRFGLR